MGQDLAVGVTLMGDDGFTPAHFPAGTAKADLPGWAAERITNPAAWSSEDPAAGGDSAEPERRAPAADPPPKSGPGSGLTAWTAYAATRGVGVPGDAKRDDVVAALDAAGVPTE